MIKLVIFDLDGVLVDTKIAHFKALNKALVEFGQEPISYDDHLLHFDGLPTFAKLEKLKIPQEIDLQISLTKQKYTLELLDDCAINPDLINFYKLKSENFGSIEIAIVTNSSETTLFFFKNKFRRMNERNPNWQYEPYAVGPGFQLNGVELFAKPSASMYMWTMVEMGVEPHETLIIEDSPKGLEGAYASGAHVLHVKDIYDASYPKIQNTIDRINLSSQRKPKIVSLDAPDMNILIPMAGAGSRFREAGYTFPKPLIEVNGKPMIQAVVENIGVNGHYIFICQEEHYTQYNLGSMLNLIAPGCDVVRISKMTEGAASTALLAKQLINNDKPLLIANSDQYLEWNAVDFLYKARHYDGGMVCFNATHPKWSFAKVEDGLVTEVAEKNPISNIATTGIYYYANGSDFVKYAEQMISKNIRTNNEFYIAPVYNQAIADGKKIVPYMIENMWGLGTPEDLRYYLEQHGR